MSVPDAKTEGGAGEGSRGWYRELGRYQWFVFVVAALGWLFDTMDQQLFNLARVPAMLELLTPGGADGPPPGAVEKYGGYATAVFLIGWATGGLFFGRLGDRIGRAKTMLITILAYSLCTGLSAFAQSFWDFAVFRFLTGLGVGGEFAVGVSLVAEEMPARARPYALGLLQALSAVGNIIAACISIGLGHLESTGVLASWEILGYTLSAWRAMFLVGTVPALLVVLVRRRLREPDRWHEARTAGGRSARLGSYGELLGVPRWRRRAVVGLLLATSGVIGVWGIGFFAIDLNRSVLRKVFEDEARRNGAADEDREFLSILLFEPGAWSSLGERVKARELLGPTRESNEPGEIFAALGALATRGERISPEALARELDLRVTAPARREALRSHVAKLTSASSTELEVSARVEAHVERIGRRSLELSGRVTRWAGYTSILLNVGAFFGIYAFSLLTARVGRRRAFAVSFTAAGLSTALVFSSLESLADVFWMIPLMGFCLLSLFGGYAVYFPELFPTRLRSTGVSLCYNVGRFLAALGPFSLGLLTSEVFAHHAEPMRAAGVTMCSVFLIGLCALPFAPETRGEPLPE